MTADVAGDRMGDGEAAVIRPTGRAQPKRVVFSSGIGKLHIVQSAIDFKAGHPEIEVLLVTSWVPSPMVSAVLRAVGLGKIARRLQVRQEAVGTVDRTIGLLLPELFYYGLKRVMAAEAALGFAFILFGLRSARRVKPFLDRDTVVHIRSGGGRGLIATARSAGAAVVVDHSIAHPSSFSHYLADVAHFVPKGTLDEKNGLWRGVARDCDEADLILVNSDFVRQTLLDSGFADDRIAVSHLGVAPGFLLIDRSPARQDHGFDLFFSGHFDARKGCGLLLRIMALLADRAPDVRLHVAGSVSESGRAIIDELGAPPNVIFHGFIGLCELQRQLADAGLFVFPTHLEGCSRSVMEAMAAGLPVLTTPQSGAPITDGVDGVLLESHDPALWAETIIGLRDDPHKRNALGVAARKMLSTGFSARDYSERLLAAYERLGPK